MKIIVISFILKLYFTVYIIKSIKGMCGQKIVNLARNIVKKPVKIAKVKRDIRFLLHCKKNLTTILTRSNFAVGINNYLQIKYRTVKNTINIFSSNYLISEEEYALPFSSDEYTLNKNYAKATRATGTTKDKDKKNM